MKSVGIREAKARLSALARSAAAGEPTLLTDHGKPIAVITSLAEDSAEENERPPPTDPAAFRRALLAMPHQLEIDF